MLTKKTLLGVVFCSLVFPICSLLYGQATGSLSGTVSDATGSVIPGAKVAVTSQGTGASREAKTDDTGRFLVPLLPVGIYTMRVEFQGFQAAEQKDVRLQVDEHRELDFALAPASLTQTVQVTATAVAVQTANPTLGQVITSQQVAQLPLNGRNFVQLATLTPGTTQETNTHSFFNGGGSSEVSTRGSYSLSVGGSRVSSTDWLLDGVDNNELTAGGIAILPSIDAIQEFKVLTFNYSAQYGTRAGPTVLVTTKSGSNDFHGSLFEFLRNTKLDARSFFAPEREVFIQNQFGGSLGGPIKKDKTFFFADYQGKRSRRGINFVGQVPTLAMLKGDFTESFKDVAPFQLTNPFTNFGFPGGTPFLCDSSGNPSPTNVSGVQTAGTPCNKIPQSLINPIGQSLVNLYPPANNLGPGFLSSDFVNTPVKKLDEGAFNIRLDHNFSNKDSLFARFSYDQATVFQPGGSPGFAEQDTFASTQNLANHGRNAALSETHIFSGNSINQLNLGYNRIFNFIQSFGDGSCEAQKLGIPGANLGGISCGLTSMIVSGFWSLGDRGFAPFTGGTNIFFISDSFDAIRGKHDIKFGGEIRANQMNVTTSAFQDGFWVFVPAFTGNSLADLLLGLPVFGQHDQVFQGATTGRRWKLFRPYIQDDWRVTSNLTLNLGLAWALVTPITENHDRQANFDFATGTWHIAGQGSDSRAGVKMDKTAIEPRIGLAWRPRGSQKTAVRAGYAIFHDSSWNQGAQGLWENPPFFGSSFVPFGSSISQGFDILTQPTDPSTFGGNISSQNLNFKQGTVQQFNVNVERLMPGDVLLTVGYAGARSTHLLIDGLNLNVASPGACGTTPGYTFGCGITSVPFPQFGNIANISDAGFARYESLQVKAETKSARHGLYGLLSYTYARAWDSGLSDGLGSTAGGVYYPLPGTQESDKGFSQIQLNHNFTTSIIYDLPFGKGKRFGSNWGSVGNNLLGGWEVDVIEKITSGFPLFPIQSGNSSGVNFAFGIGNRPDRICNGRLSNPTVQKFFDTSCFADPLSGQLGNSSRTPLFGPGFVNTDFSVNKRFRLPFREGTELEFRTEFFNLFNHAQFFLPGQDVDSAGFGQITETVNNPRLIQFALKLRF